MDQRVVVCNLLRGSVKLLLHEWSATDPNLLYVLPEILVDHGGKEGVHPPWLLLCNAIETL